MNTINATLPPVSSSNISFESASIVKIQFTVTSDTIIDINGRKVKSLTGKIINVAEINTDSISQKMTGFNSVYMMSTYSFQENANIVVISFNFAILFYQ